MSRRSAANFALDNQLQADFMTGPLPTRFWLGFDYFNLWANTDYRSAGIAPIDAYNPVYGAAIPSFASLAPFILRDDSQMQAGLYLQDQIKLDRWTLSLSGRQDWASTGFTSKAFFPPAGTYTRDDSAQTGRVGLNYLFDFGLVALRQLLDLVHAEPRRRPLRQSRSSRPRARATRSASSSSPTASNLMLTAALFDITQNNVLTADPAIPFFNMQTDAVRVRGFEFEAQGQRHPRAGDHRRLTAISIRR